MRKIVPSLALVLCMMGCRTPVYLGGEFTHGGTPPSSPGPSPMENLVDHDRWIFFWGLAGTEKIDVPEAGGGFDFEKELAARYGEDEKLVDLTVEEGVTIPGIITGFFTIGIVSQKEIVVKARKAPRSAATSPAPARVDTTPPPSGP